MVITSGCQSGYGGSIPPTRSKLKSSRFSLELFDLLAGWGIERVGMRQSRPNGISRMSMNVNE